MRLAAVGVGAMVLLGCARPPGGFESPVPSQRLRAATDAAERKDPAAIPDLIRLLESDDPVVRMAAIRSLERITGQTLGYDHAGPERERQEAVRAWVEWHEGGSGRERP